MRKYTLPSLLVLCSLFSQAQTFNECVTEFQTKYKQIQLDAVTQKRNQKKMDSLYRTLESSFDACIIGNELPEFRLLGSDGRTYSNENLSGKVLYLNLWTVGCGACWAEIPVLNKVATSYDDKDFVFVSILLDTEEDLEKILQRRGIGTIDPERGGLPKPEFDIVTNPAPFGSNDLRKVLAAPTHLFIDKNGKISKRLVGALSETYLKATIDEMLAQ